MNRLDVWATGTGKDVEADLINKVTDFLPHIEKGHKTLHLASGKVMHVRNVWVAANNPRVGQYVVIDESDPRKCWCVAGNAFKQQYIKKAQNKEKVK